MTNETHIVSMIIYTHPEYLEEVLEKAKRLPEAECHTNIPEQKFVLVFEAESEASLSYFMEEINNWKGVLSSQLCYQHCETNESLQEEIHHETHAS